MRSGPPFLRPPGARIAIADDPFHGRGREVHLRRTRASRHLPGLQEARLDRLGYLVQFLLSVLEHTLMLTRTCWSAARLLGHVGILWGRAG